MAALLIILIILIYGTPNLNLWNEIQVCKITNSKETFLQFEVLYFGM